MKFVAKVGGKAGNHTAYVYFGGFCLWCSAEYHTQAEAQAAADKKLAEIMAEAGVQFADREVS
jgi:hypothetical protein